MKTAVIESDGMTGFPPWGKAGIALGSVMFICWVAYILLNFILSGQKTDMQDLKLGVSQLIEQQTRIISLQEKQNAIQERSNTQLQEINIRLGQRK